MLFDEAFERVIGHEGGYVWDELDPGGETKFGISKRSHPGEDIKNLTLERAKEIYKLGYWGPAGCDSVPGYLRYPLFDMAVNQGVKTAIKALQHAVHEVEDGILGPRTLQAVNSAHPPQVLYRFVAARLVAYAKTPDAQWARFGRGWIRRVAATMLEAA